MFYLFEDFALDTGRRELRRNDAPVAVEPKVFDLIVHLVENRDRVADKDDLIASVWGGRIVSESALSSAVKAARGALGDDGERQRLIRTLPRKGVRFVGTVTEAASPAGHPPAAGATPAAPGDHTLPDGPTLAVLPFATMSASPEQDYFTDGVVEEIIDALSQNRWLFVIARNSSFTYKGREVDVQQVGRDLGVRYVLTGSVRRSASRIRVAAQLADAATRANLWVGQVEGTPDDIFDLQDEVTRSVVGTIVAKLEGAEIDRAQRKPTGNLTAYDHYLRGLAAAHRQSREDNIEAADWSRRACALDPAFAAAHGLGAFCYTQRKAWGWMDDPGRDVPEAARLARRAAELGRHDALALARAGQVLAYVVHELETGSALLDTALSLNPNLAFAWWWRGWCRIWQGDPESGIEMIQRGLRLSPLDPFLSQMRMALAHGHFYCGQYDEAVAWALRTAAGAPNSHGAYRILTVAAAFAGDLKRAREAADRLRQLDPGLRVSTVRHLLGPYGPDDLAKYEEGLRRAGFPE